MSPEPNTPSVIEQAVSRALRDNLERIQRTSDELHEAIADVVAACASSKPVNALPPMLRAQTSAASLGASLEVFARFVAVSLQPGPRSPFESEIARIAGTLAAAEAAVEARQPDRTAPVQPTPAAPAAHISSQVALPAVEERHVTQEPHQAVPDAHVEAHLPRVDGNVSAHGGAHVAEPHEMENAPPAL